MSSFARIARVVGVPALALAAVATPARADEVYLAGFTNGCFGTVCIPSMTATFQGLMYSNSQFSGTTASGFRGLGSVPTPGTNFNNLGSLTLATTPYPGYATTFSMQITFTAPQGISGSNQATFTSTVTGSVISDNIGGVQFDFNNTPVLFSFSDAVCEPDPTGGIPGQQTTCGSGSFLFSVNDLAIDPGQTVALTGQITSAQQSTVPEPATLALVGTGLAGIFAARRRRKNG